MTDARVTQALLTREGRVMVELPDGSFQAATGRTDWQRVGAMTEAGAAAAAMADPYAPPPCRARRAPSPCNV